MSIKKLGQGKYLVDLRFYESGKEFRVRRKVYGSLKTVREWEANLKNEFRHGRLIKKKERSEKVLFHDFSQEWFETYVKANNKIGEQRNKEMVLRVHLVPFFGEFYLHEITAKDIEKYKARLVSSEYSASTVNLHLACLNKLFQCALDWEMVDRNPVIKVSGVKARKDVWQFLDFDEADRFLAAVPEKWQPLFLMAIRTGMRQGEIIGLRWKDIGWGRNIIRVCNSWYEGQLGPTKSYASREIPMTSDLFNCLLKHREKSSSEYVFPAQSGKPLHRKTLNRPLFSAIKKSGVKKIRFHDLRHTYASHMVMSGVPIKTVQELLGHADLKMTLRYAHLTPACREEAAKALEGKILNFRGHISDTLEESLKT